eukprot:gene2279-2452_t
MFKKLFQGSGLFDSSGFESPFTPTSIKDNTSYSEICKKVEKKIKIRRSVNIDSDKVLKILRSMLIIYTGYIDIVDKNNKRKTNIIIMTENVIGIFDLDENFVSKIGYFDIKHILHQYEKTNKGSIIFLLNDDHIKELYCFNKFEIFEFINISVFALQDIKEILKKEENHKMESQKSSLSLSKQIKEKKEENYKEKLSIKSIKNIMDYKKTKKLVLYEYPNYYFQNNFDYEKLLENSMIISTLLNFNDQKIILSDLIKNENEEKLYLILSKTHLFLFNEFELIRKIKIKNIMEINEIGSGGIDVGVGSSSVGSRLNDDVDVGNGNRLNDDLGLELNNELNDNTLLNQKIKLKIKNESNLIIYSKNRKEKIINLLKEKNENIKIKEEKEEKEELKEYNIRLRDVNDIRNEIRKLENELDKEQEEEEELMERIENLIEVSISKGIENEKLFQNFYSKYEKKKNSILLKEKFEKNLKKKKLQNTLKIKKDLNEEEKKEIEKLINLEKKKEELFNSDDWSINDDTINNDELIEYLKFQLKRSKKYFEIENILKFNKILKINEQNSDSGTTQWIENIDEIEKKKFEFSKKPFEYFIKIEQMGLPENRIESKRFLIFIDTFDRLGYNIKKEKIILTKIGIEKELSLFNRKSKSPFCHHIITIELLNSINLENDQIISLKLSNQQENEIKFQNIITFKKNEKMKIIGVLTRVLIAPSINDNLMMNKSLWNIQKYENSIWDKKLNSNQTIWRIISTNKIIKEHGLKNLRSNLGLFKPPKYADITIIAGRNLISCDSNGFSDPYILMKYETTKFKSERIEKTLHPIFKNATMRIEFNKIPHNLVIECFDFNYTSSSQFMGEINIPVSDLYAGEFWYTLQPNLSDYPNSEVSGDLKILTTFYFHDFI